MTTGGQLFRVPDHGGVARMNVVLYRSLGISTVVIRCAL
jgi:hypothetical protein